MCQMPHNKVITTDTNQTNVITHTDNNSKTSQRV